MCTLSHQKTFSIMCLPARKQIGKMFLIKAQLTKVFAWLTLFINYRFKASTIMIPIILSYLVFNVFLSWSERKDIILSTSRSGQRKTRASLGKGPGNSLCCVTLWREGSQCCGTGGLCLRSCLLAGFYSQAFLGNAVAVWVFCLLLRGTSSRLHDNCHHQFRSKSNLSI